jgi:hypothetical protein
VAVRLAEDDLAAAAVEDRPGRRQLDADARQADEQRRQAEPLGEDALVLDPVLQREDDRPGAEGRPEGVRRGRRVVRLDADEHEVGGRRVGGPLDGARTDVERPVGAAEEDPQPLRAERRQVGAAGDQRDVVAAAGEQRAEVAADRAGAEDEHVHRPILPAAHAA